MCCVRVYIFCAEGVTPIDSIVMAVTTRSKLWPALFGILTVDHTDFQALNIDCIEFQPWTVDYVHIYGSIRKNA